MKTHAIVRGRGMRRAGLVVAALTMTSGAFALQASVPAPHVESSQAAETAARSEAAPRARTAASFAATARRHVRRGDVALVRGRLRPGRSGRRVRVQLWRDGRWRTVDVARTRPRGRFTASWRAKRSGRWKLRALFAGDGRNRAAAATLGRVNVYRPAQASYYGPGLYGNRTACGKTLTPSTVGVAHRTLPCGTRVSFRYRGRSAAVRVIDRGPFHGSREWDLTAAAKRKLGFGSTGTVWSTR